jgi:beta-N-acetylhexosaminidase
MTSKHSVTLRRQVGQLLVMGFDGTTLSPRLRAMLETFQPGGLIFFQRNLQDVPQAYRLVRDAQQASDTPMFLCVDMEGGLVDRLCDVIAPVPSVAEVAATGSKKLFRKHGCLMGQELRALGFKVDFAPVLDLQLAPSKDVLGSRTVSAKPKPTVAYAREFLRGLRDCDILGCGKHFPGLGEAELDTHAELPTIDKPLKRLWKEDLVPYRKLRRELPFVMVAHASYPKVTGDTAPASLSKKWMSGVLRKKIGYRGLIITDDLDMGGVLAAAPVEVAAVETLRAGADMFLICQKEDSVRRAFDAVLQRAERDKKFARLIAEKSERVLEAKKRGKPRKRGMALPPTRQAVERLMRKLWEFSEEVRAQALLSRR